MKATAARGFTLLEVMVVMLIVAVLAAIAVPNIFAGTARGKDLEREASMLAARLRVAQDDAMTYGEEYGLVFTEAGYRFVRWDPAVYRFVVLPADRSWSSREFRDEVYVSASADEGNPILVLPEKPPEDVADSEQDKAEEEWQPSVFVLSSGEVTPFTAIFRAEGSEETLELRVDPLGSRLQPREDGKQPAGETRDAG